MSDLKKPVELTDEQMEQISGGNTLVCIESTVTNFTGTYAIYTIFKCANPSVPAATAAGALNHPICSYSNTGLCKDCRDYTELGAVRKDSCGPMLAGWEASGYTIVYK